MSPEPGIRVALVAEELSAHPDEGVLRFLEQFATFLTSRHETIVLHTRGNAPAGVTAQKIRFTRLGVSGELRAALRSFRPALVFYVPSASLTPNAMWRTWCLRLVSGAPVVLVGLQRRPPSLARNAAARMFRPDALVVTSVSVAEEFRFRGWTTIVARLGVDLDRFQPLDASRKHAVRSRLGWSDDRKVILHVGHLRTNRGVEALVELAGDPAFRVVMVASISESAEAEVADRLREGGVELHHEYCAEIEQFYQGADLYVFPVRDERSAIESPLSVYEALACGLPVLTTPFGSLPERFDGTGAVRFIPEGISWRDAVTLPREAGPTARALAESLGWEHSLTSLMDSIREVVR